MAPTNTLPKIYGIVGSPPYAAVLMCAKVLGIKLDIESVNLIAGDQLKEDFIKKNPQHTVPLLDDSGFLLADSHAINGYLVGKYGKENDPLYPKDDIKRRAIIDHRLHLDSGIVSSKGLSITRPLVISNIEPTKFALDGLKDAFVILNRQIEAQNTKYIAGDILSIADFSVTTTVTYWGYFVTNWPNEFPSLNAYIERMKEEYWYQVGVEGAKGFYGLMDAKMKQFEK